MREASPSSFWTRFCFSVAPSCFLNPLRRRPPASAIARRRYGMRSFGAIPANTPHAVSGHDRRAPGACAQVGPVRAPAHVAVGLCGHELLILRRAGQQPASTHREWSTERFEGRPDAVCYTVIGKGGLIREVVLPGHLAERLEERRWELPKEVTDRGVYCIQHYDIGGGQAWSQSFSAAGKREIDWSCRAEYPVPTPWRLSARKWGISGLTSRRSVCAEAPCVGRRHAPGH